MTVNGEAPIASLDLTTSGDTVNTDMPIPFWMIGPWKERGDPRPNIHIPPSIPTRVHRNFSFSLPTDDRRIQRDFSYPPVIPIPTRHIPIVTQRQGAIGSQSV